MRDTKRRGGGGERKGRDRQTDTHRRKIGGRKEKEGGREGERQREDDGRIHPVSGSLPSEKMAHESKHQKRVVSRKIENVEELETPSAST